MIRRSASVVLALGIAMVTSISPVALADDNDNGFRIGDGRLHPYLDLGGVYDTDAQLNIDANGNAVGVPDIILHVRPGLKLDVPSPFFSVGLSGDADYLVYMGITDPSSRGLDHLEGQADLDLGILRGSIVSFDLGDHFLRSTQSANTALTFGVLSLYNDARASATISPGGGALTITPGYHFTLENFSPLYSGPTLCPPGNTDPGCSETDLQEMDYQNHTISLENRWRFLPKTAFMLDGEYDLRTYSYPSFEGTPNTPISSVKATTGVAGLVTPHISTIARVGFGMDISDKSYESVIGQLEGSFLPNETSAIKLGYLRTFEPVPSPYITMGDDRGYLEAHILLLSRLTLHIYAALDYLTFRGDSDVTPRNDLDISGIAGADFEAFRWWIISLADGVMKRSSSVNDPTLNYLDDQVTLTFRFIY